MVNQQREELRIIDKLSVLDDYPRRPVGQLQILRNNNNHEFSAITFTDFRRMSLFSCLAHVLHKLLGGRTQGIKC